MNTKIFGKWWFWVIAVLVFLMVGSVLFGEDTEQAGEQETETETETEASGWRAELSPELVAEIEAAFAEIGENPDAIVSVEYVDLHTSGYVFEQKCYKVELSRFGFKHSRHYRIVTQNYYEGEPEKEEYPNEFLCTIKYWVGDDGHGTNVNQWSHTGNGKKQ